MSNNSMSNKSLTTPTLPMDAVLPVLSDTDSLDTALLDTELLDMDLLDMELLLMPPLWSTLHLPTMPPWSTLPLLTMPLWLPTLLPTPLLRSTLTRFPPTPTTTPWLMTTPTPTSS